MDNKNTHKYYTQCPSALSNEGLEGSTSEYKASDVEVDVPPVC